MNYQKKIDILRIEDNSKLNLINKIKLKKNF